MAKTPTLAHSRNRTRRPLLTLAPILIGVFAVALSPGGRALAAAGPSTPENASFRVVFENGIGGSSTAIHPRILVSNAHVAIATNLRCTASNHVSGLRVQGTSFCRDATADLALILLDQDVPYVRVDTRGIQTAQQLERFGFGGSGRFVKVICNLLNRNSYQGDVRFCSLSQPSISGDSGGGIFSGNLYVGTLHSTNQSTTFGTEAPYLVRMVSAFDARHNTQLGCTLFGGCAPRRGGFGGNNGGGRQPVLPGDLGRLPPNYPEPQPTPQPTTQPIELDLDALAAKIAAMLPTPKNGVDGKDGKPGQNGIPGAAGTPGAPGADGRGIASAEMVIGPDGKPTGQMRITYTDGEVVNLPNMGITVRLWDASGTLSDSEFVPIGGELNLKQTVRGVK